MEKVCQNCGIQLAVNAPAGLCPACLMKVALATGSEKTGFTPPSVEELEQKFPQLEIIELIGRGGMGAVYKARQKGLERVVALKILPPGIGGDAGFAERFTREARALARLNHPGIVTVHDSGRANGLYFFVMEFVDGVTLRDLLALGRISPREALAIVPQICDALQFAHDQGIVHRDIKPENILLNRRGQVKVADFGLAKIIEDRLPAASSNADTPEAMRPAIEPSDGKVMGTPAYMAPEQAKHPNEVDHRADIYALGVVFYQMLTGELPGKRIEPPSHKVQIDVRLDEVVLRALEKKPELRYQQASEVKTVLETIATTLSAAPSAESRGKLEEASTFKPPAGPVELRMKWVPGVRLVREEQLEQAMEIYNPGQAEPMKQDFSLDLRFSLTVVSDASSEEREVELQFLSARMGMVMGSYQWQYDSSRKTPADTSQAAELFGKIVGAKLRYFLDAVNEIERVEGMDELMKRLGYSLGGVRPKADMEWDKKEMDDLLQRLVSRARRPDHFAGVRQMFSKAFFKQLARRSVFLPSRPVQPGDSWPVADEYAMDFLRTLVREFTVSFAGWEARGKRMCARLEYEGTEKTKTEPESSTLAKLLKPKTEGTVSGVVWFEPELGVVIETHTRRDFGVTMNKPVNPNPMAHTTMEMQSTTDRHHQVLVDKLISVRELGSGGV